MFNRAKWPVKVVIFEKRSNSMVIVKDKARRFKDGASAVEYYQLKNKKDKLPAIDFKNLMPGNTLFIYSPTSGVYYPLEFDEKGKFTAEDIDMKYLYSTEIERNVTKFRFKSNIEKFITVILVIVTGFILGLIFYMTVPKLTAMASQTASMSANMVEAMDLLKETIELRCSVQQLPPAS